LPACAISSQLHQLVSDFDLILEDSHPAFENSGLRASSIFRLANPAVLSPADIAGTIGFLEKELHERLLRNLSDFLLDQ
jgi:hypothetical protein